jgi:HlyD family secretion protein
MKLTKRRITVLVILVIVVAGVIITVTTRKEKVKPTSITVEVAEIRHLISTVSATGEIEPVTQVKVSAEIPGRIVDLPVKEGDVVQKNQFLAELNPETYRSALEEATSALRSARASRQKADADLKRISGLVEKGMASDADLDAAKAQAELTAGDLDRVVAMEKNSRENLSKTRIIAPMSGTISRLNKEIGELTLGSQFQEDVIMIVADLSKMQVRAEVDENDIPGVKLGDSASVEIDAFPDTTFRGLVTEISQSAVQPSGLGTEVQAKNFDVKVTILDDVRGIRPGMSATVDIATGYRDNALSVSLQCVAVRDKEEGKAVEIKEKESPKSSRQVAAEVRSGTADSSRFQKKESLEEGVFVLAGDTAAWRPVKTGLSSERHIEILDGLSAGDSVINGPYRVLAKDLKRGDKVTIKKEDKNAKMGKRG